MAEILANMAIGERGSPSLGQGEGQKKEWSVLVLDAETFKKYHMFNAFVFL